MREDCPHAPALSREDRARATSAGSPALAGLFRDVPIAYTMWERRVVQDLMAPHPDIPPCILIVDDDEATRELLEIVLDEAGYTTLLATSRDDARAVMAMERVDLILTDLSHPLPLTASDGLQALLAHAGQRPVGIMSGWNGSAEELQSHGFAFVIRKPFDLDDLVLSVARALVMPVRAEHDPQASVVHAYFAALTAHDWETLLALCTDTITYVLPTPVPFSATLHGKAAFRAYTDATFDHFPHTQFGDVQVYASPHGMAAHYPASWTDHAGSVAHLEGAVIFSFRGDVIDKIGVLLDADKLHTLLRTSDTGYDRGNQASDG